MKAVSNDYKNAIKQSGRQIDAKVTYTLNNEEIELGANELNSLTPHYEGGILKSVMKQLDLDSNVDIPLGTILEAQFGVLIDNQYEYISLGQFVVYSSEKQEDLKSYKIVCYDKMLYAMKDYEAFATYPITIRDYIDALCDHIGLDFANSSDTFANYDKELPSELYLDATGNSLDYTFRDVLDQLAEVTASTICINDDGELEIRYITDTEEEIDEDSLKDINVNFGEHYGAINTIIFSRSADSDSIHYPDPLPANPVELKISNNQFLNDDNRADYFPDIYNVLNGLEYYTNDFVSTGITYLDLCDRYDVTIDNQTYSCVMFNDEIQITQGLVENIHTDLPEGSVTDYNTTTKDDRSSTRTTLIVDKINNEIRAVVEASEQVVILIDGQTNYELTKDATFVSGKTYYIQEGNEYIEYNQYSTYEDERTGNPSQLGLYEGLYSYTYVETEDTTFDDDTTYYEKIENDYGHTLDTTIQANKQYYIYYNNNYELLTYNSANQEYWYEDEDSGDLWTWSVGGNVPTNEFAFYEYYTTPVYIKYTGSRTGDPSALGLYEQVENLISYQLTSDNTFVSGKTYFEQNYDIGDNIPADTIYEAVITPSVSEQINGLSSEIDNQLEGFEGTITNIQRSVNEVTTNTYTKTEIQQIVDGRGTGGVVVSATISEVGQFDKDGLLIKKESGGSIVSQTTGRFNEKGMQIKAVTGGSEGNEVLFAGHVDDSRFDVGSRHYTGKTIVYTQNLQAGGETIIGSNCLLKDYESGTGWFVL